MENVYDISIAATRPSILRRVVLNLSTDQGPARVDTVVANLLIRVGHELHDLLLDTDLLQESIHKQKSNKHALIRRCLGVACATRHYK